MLKILIALALGTVTLIPVSAASAESENGGADHDKFVSQGLTQIEPVQLGVLTGPDNASPR